jgi:hypothetical protein
MKTTTLKILIAFLFLSITMKAQMPTTNESRKTKETTSPSYKLAHIEKIITHTDTDSIAISDLLVDKDMDTTFAESNKINTLFPSLNKDKKVEFFDKLFNKNKNGEYLIANNAVFQFGEKSTLSQSELVSSLMGPLRLSFGTLITNSKTSNNGTSTAKADPVTADDNSTTDAFQRLRNNGGNVYLNIDFPVYCYLSDSFTIYSNLYTKGGIVFSNFSNDVDTSSGNGSTGLNLYMSAADDYDKFVFFLNANYAYQYGSTEFYQKLNLMDDKAFGFGQVTFGVNIAKTFRFGYTLKTFASDESLRTTKGVLSIQLINPF